MLEVDGLTVEFRSLHGPVRAVDGVSFTIGAGETVGLVGESGCGKTVTGLSLLKLVPSPPGRYAAGSVRLSGQDLLAMPESGLRAIRGRALAMIFQEPMTALNPVFTVASQMTEVLRRHGALGRREARDAALALLKSVGIPEPEQRLDDYPHQLSGGQRQRVMIAMALSCDPKLLIADEPTTALDVTTQAQVLEEIRRQQATRRMAMLLVTHDLGVVFETCARAIVMYCGVIVESAPVAKLFSAPRHPYTTGLLESMPRIRDEKLRELPTIPGRVPELHRLPPGCRFADRCPRAKDDCRAVEPQLTTAADGSQVACHHPS
ncbi:MAG: ABC transporter ATP-binding protein [Gammaproteobacteria bacterium]|nr:ABC transporter ATP-binding protein [Gammaproteobacteria bacterium]